MHVHRGISRRERTIRRAGAQRLADGIVAGGAPMFVSTTINDEPDGAGREKATDSLRDDAIGERLTARPREPYLHPEAPIV